MARQPPIADVAASASDDGDSGGSHKATEQEEQEQPEERDNGGEPALSSASKRKRKPSKHAVKELEAAGLEAAWFAEDAENDALVSNLKAWCEALGLSNVQAPAVGECRRDVPETPTSLPVATLQIHSLQCVKLPFNSL